MASEPGLKFDQQKPLWHLLPFRELEDVVRVLSYGAAKYTADGWQTLPDAKDRYFAATLRHMVAWRNGEAKDSESGLSHLAHAACSVLFVMWHDRKEKEETQKAPDTVFSVARFGTNGHAILEDALREVDEHFRGLQQAHVLNTSQHACDKVFGKGQFDFRKMMNALDLVLDALPNRRRA